MHHAVPLITRFLLMVSSWVRRQGEITSLEDALKAVRKENDALRKQHAVADHHLADLGKVGVSIDGLDIGSELTARNTSRW